MSAAVWNEPQAADGGRQAAHHGPSGTRETGVLTMAKIIPAPRRPAAGELPRACDPVRPAPAETT